MSTSTKSSIDKKQFYYEKKYDMMEAEYLSAAKLINNTSTLENLPAVELINNASTSENLASIARTPVLLDASEGEAVDREEKLHAICRNTVAEEGYGSRILCYIYPKEGNIKKQRKRAPQNQKRSAEKMKDTSSNKFKDVLAGSTVLIHIPKYAINLEIRIQHEFLTTDAELSNVENDNDLMQTLSSKGVVVANQAIAEKSDAYTEDGENTLQPALSNKNENKNDFKFTKDTNDMSKANVNEIKSDLD
ncbi:hypothetical protein ILUMI_03809 [Ignelater luminosus]|uniref:SCAN domain-containing protein n=1 Tax=Ignelater luminosus TaxID=2038154 RepID=A0A8K0DFJ5_IGNLU|nr:hypothetical protein ILUMI_03809 [Ignelater luminosus]